MYAGVERPSSFLGTESSAGDGRQVLRSVRMSSFDPIPVVVLSTSSRDSDKQLSLRPGSHTLRQQTQQL